MKLAVMQPYFFPYLGYFQLIHAVDRFVIYDDVSFIKQGWINRNFILMNCQPLLVTVPLSKASSFKIISEVKVSQNFAWREKFLKTLRQAYFKAPNFVTVFTLVEDVICRDWESIGELALSSIRAVMEYLELNTEIRSTSRYYGNSHLKRQERILDICRREEAKTYYNLPGGQELYDRDYFATAGVELRFIQPRGPCYSQFQCEFVPNLSILDVLMFNDIRTIQGFLMGYEVI